jgi:mono/diheme cytochrome c family protein
MARALRWAVRAALVCGGLAAVAAGDSATTEPAVDVHMRTPAEEAATIVLPPGYHLELVAAEPDLVCPCLCEWDGDGRMYVAELRSYMLNINGSNAHTPISRVSRWESTRNDGVYDKHTIYADHLMLPRMVLPLDDRVLIRETDTKDIWCYRDTHGDGVAEEKAKIYQGGHQEGNLEHQPSGLVWDIDNWIYVTNQSERFRFTRGTMERSPLPFHPGQWGIATSETGQVLFSTAGSERPAHNFQVMPQYGNIGVEGELANDFTAVYPIEHLTDVEGGPPRLRPGGGLNRFSGCCGPSFYQGDALPADLRGDLLIPEPVGRLIRRAKVTVQDGRTTLTNAYDQAEFIASPDPNFRPVWTATGPDGLLYICDMYHGIIQEANWTKVGSYLRPQILKYGLQHNVGKGRIWRVVHDGYKPRPMPHMLEETPAQLVGHLADANGWWRDTAQKLIVLKHDLSVVPALEAMARSHADPLARLHAVWTLEGLDAVTSGTLAAALADGDPRVRSAAVRVAEPRLAKGDPAVAAAVGALANDPDPNVATQVCLSLLTTLRPPPAAAPTVVQTVADVRPATQPATRPATQPSIDAAMVDVAVAAATRRHAYAAEVVGIWRRNEARAAADALREAMIASADKAKGELYARGRELYGQTCIACHAGDGGGMPTPERDGRTLAPPLRGSRKLMADPLVVCRIVLRGLSGPNDGHVYPGQMASFATLDDGYLAAVLTYARNDWGNSAPAVRPEDVAAVRQQSAGRAGPFTVPELYAAAEAAAPVTPTGARVDPAPGEVVLDPASAVLHGGTLRVDCYPSGLDVGYWHDGHDWVSWSTRLPAGDYDVAARTSSAEGARRIVVRVDGQDRPGEVPRTAAWDAYRDVPVGTVHVDHDADVSVDVRAADPAQWGPMNVAAVRLRRRS